MSKMDPELKSKWVAALRSGEYQQGVGNLCNPEVEANYLGDGKFIPSLKVEECEFCCLGVLAHIQGEIGTYHISDEYLHGNHAESWGILDLETDLANRNDRGDSFEELADYIEDNL